MPVVPKNSPAEVHEEVLTTQVFAIALGVLMPAPAVHLDDEAGCLERRIYLIRTDGQLRPPTHEWPNDAVQQAFGFAPAASSSDGKQFGRFG